MRTFSNIIAKYTQLQYKLNKTKGTTKANFVKTDLEYWPDKALSGSLRQFEVKLDVLRLYKSCVV